ncbi:hypothetical protein ACFL5J_00230 [Thermodesulfobacteriota bacterium]
MSLPLPERSTEMHREINPPEEIFRRLLFVLYLAVIVVFLVGVLLSLVQQRFDYLLFILPAGAAAVLLRVHGKKRFHFDRLAASFPHGIAEQDVPGSELCDEVAKLLAAASRIEKDWPQRQQLRNRLLTLLDQHPGLWQKFGKEITAVFPVLGQWTGNNRGGQ